MGFKIATLWQTPEINPINGKARSIPVLNPFDKHGRVFFFSWLGFMVAFLSWYAFPPLLTLTIKKDLHLSQNEIANSNIVALTATLLIRIVAGPACDYFGPKVTFAACLFLGAVPTALAGTVKSASGLIVLRFFIGILGGTFVPCQVWTTSYFDKNVVGTANALTAGWGNAGGGVTYFVMPAIYDSLIADRHLTPAVAWRVAFVVPFILIVAIAVGMLTLCDDCPTGPWSSRHHAVNRNVEVHGPSSADGAFNVADNKVGSGARSVAETNALRPHSKMYNLDADTSDLGAAKGEVVRDPTWHEALRVSLSPQTIVLAACYMCSFGAELAINSILGAYYFENFQYLGQTGTGRWAAMFGLVNVVFRPLGGIVADIIYRRTGKVYTKKIWIHLLGFGTGAFLIIIGVLDSKTPSVMFGLVVGMAFFLDAGNGACFALVPHVHPAANGIVSGITGAAGNFGGIIFAIIFRYMGTHFGQTFWAIGVITIGINLGFSWIKPIPFGQVGGR